jgi:hypothetical protein
VEASEVMQMLIEIEKALRKRDYSTAFAALFEAETRLLRLERESIARQSRNLKRAA